MFPAHAGMNRNTLGGTGALTNVPRTRGDEPGAEVSDQLLDMDLGNLHSIFNLLSIILSGQYGQ